MKNCTNCGQPKKSNNGRRCRSCANKARPVSPKVKRHGKHKHPLYAVWASLKDRCSNPNNVQWKTYGGRGITCCALWSSFITFYVWAIQTGWKRGLYIDRIDVNGNYCPGNCRFVTPAVSAFNRRTTKITSGVSVKLISLRARGFSLKRVATEVGIGKTTVVNFFSGRKDRPSR
jgi:hypothetical protein